MTGAATNKATSVYAFSFVGQDTNISHKNMLACQSVTLLKKDMPLRSKTYILPVNPIAWKRAGINNKERRFFDQQAQDKVAVGLLLARQHGDEPLFSGPTRLITYFGMPLYRSSRFKHGDWHTHTPDYDNLTKFLTDAMRNVCITDDRIICWAEQRKIYDKEPCVRIELTDLSNEKTSKKQPA